MVNFQKKLRAYDPGLVLIWWEREGHPYHPRWVLYRESKSGWMIKEFELVGPNGEYRDVGDWVIRSLKALDLTTRYETEGYERARDLHLKACDDADRKEWEDEEKKRDELAMSYAEDLWFAARGRESVVISR